MDLVDPSLRSIACDACWRGVFSPEGWHTVLAGKEVPGHIGFAKGYGYKTTWTLVRAAADGCNWCRFLAKGRGKREGSIAVWLACDEDSDCTPAGEKKLTLVIHASDGGFTYLYYLMYTNADDNAAKYVAARDRITDVSTPESYRLALDCVQTCLRTHTRCPQPQPDSTLLPDRVLDCSDVQRPKIVLTGGKMCGLYVALSYVWGGPQPMTTTENISQYVTEGLDMSQFPRTIQDAVTVTHNLGLRYLWIDALCILQDSNEDKAVQLGMMRRIYRDSYLTINAACANNTREGFLHRHRPQKIPDARIPYRCPDGTVGTVYIARHNDTSACDASRSYWDELEPVTHRAWCLQERLLPPRSLIYGSDTLKLSCQTETVNIGGALCEPSTGMTLPNKLYRRHQSPSAHQSVEEGEAERAAWRSSWLATIFRYTIRSLSVASDKLPALAGVAEQFHLASGDQYLAGLWRSTLLLDLLWSIEPFGPLAPRPEKYRAPSWSWASADGIIGASYLEQRLASAGVVLCRAEVLDCVVDLAHENLPFGEVTGGVLRLKGKMKKAHPERTTGASSRMLLQGPEGELVKFGTVSFDAEEMRSEDMYVIPLVWDDLGSFAMGIAVMRTSSSRYKRVGRFGNLHGSTDVEWIKGLDDQEIVVV